jgi:hypothetical protein
MGMSGQLDKGIAKNCMLVHGMPTLQSGEHEGKPFGHCWIELSGRIVFDYSNGRDLQLEKSKYYELGKINKKKIFKYTAREVQLNVLKHKHWGPWDYSPPR